MVICSCCKPLPTQSQRSLTPSFPVPKPRACARKINYHPGGKPTQLPPFVRVCVPSELNCVKRRSRSFAPCYRWMLARNISSRMAYIGPTQLPTCVHVPSQLNLVKKRKSRSFGRSSCYRRILPRIFFFYRERRFTVATRTVEGDSAESEPSEDVCPNEPLPEGWKEAVDPVTGKVVRVLLRSPSCAVLLYRPLKENN